MATTNTYNILDLVLAVDPDGYAKPEVVYETSDGEQFENTDKKGTGIYPAS